MAPYQDLWIKNTMETKGTRSCLDRYAIVKKFCEQFSGPFSVCDIGANMCYFGIRLTEDFPECVVLAFEYNNFPMRKEHLKKSGASRVILLERKLSVEDLRNLRSCCSFDVVLAFSVLHHLREPTDVCISALKGIGKNVLLEFAMEDSRRVRVRQDYQIPEDAIPLGHGVSHLDRSVKRPIVLVKGDCA